MKIYVASSLGNADAIRSIYDVLKAAGHEITYEWAIHGSMQSHPDKWTEVALAELEGVRAADLVVVVLPGGRGTHAEMGAGLVLGKPVVIIGLESSFEQGGLTCAFYHHPGARKEVIPVRDLSVVAALALKYAGALEEKAVVA